MNRALIRYVALRLFTAIPLLLVISVFVFVLVHLAPGDAASALTGGRAISQEAMDALRAKYHLDEPMVVQYLRWLGDALTGDFGTSVQTRQPVVTAVLDRAPLSLWLTFYAAMIVLCAGVPLGLAAALRQGSRLDRSVVTLSVFGVSTPAFVSGLFLLYYLGFVAGLFPVFGAGRDGGFWTRAWHLTLPALALALSVLAIVVKITRAAVIEEMEKDYVAFARARGVPERRIMLSYLLRNAMVPVVTAASVIVVATMAGAIYVEITFALPGLGSLLVDAVRQRDIPVIQGATLFFSVFVILVNVATDILYVLIDPRIQFGKAAR
ncbi:ABC transporter permease [Meridianimarinicoccus sp. RP-17]|uniref:ABC transporter permease n=1 Tax=Meridianimarinicoccus zhengii TaxID=2056810 RepID=UPI001C9B79D7|nr:ABC transporter permease [Phycocomes zhengii]